MMKISTTKIIAPILILIGAIIFTTTIVNAFFITTVPEVEITLEDKTVGSSNKGVEVDETAVTSLPERLVIPKIGVNAKIEEVGLTPTGNMATPNNLFNTGWYKYGTIPGSKGSAVIDGHVDNALTLPGVFYDLKDLEVGDDVYVETVSGERLHFVVVEVDLYHYQNVPVEKLFNVDDAPRLNLVTCQGEWVAKDRTAESRLIVYTKLIEEV